MVDSEDINRRLLKAIFKTTPYKILEAHRASEATALLQSEKIDLVILDLMLPEMSGPELCRWMKARRSTQLIPVLMITNLQGVENEIVGISSGADEFLIKPLHPAVVRTRVRAMLRNKSLIDSLEEAETILLAMAQTVEHRDEYTGKHCQRLAVASVMLGEALGLPSQDLTALYRGGYLHDIGKIGIPDAILFKRGPLTSEEWEVMRSHPVRGEEICRPMRSLAPVLPIIRSHHERWDGSGYPDGLAGEDIPLLARILQVADIYDALTSERPYKQRSGARRGFCGYGRGSSAWMARSGIGPAICQHHSNQSKCRSHVARSIARKHALGRFPLTHRSSSSNLISLNTLEILQREIVSCEKCPRLVEYRAEVGRVKRRAYRDWDYWAKPVPGFGDPSAQLLLIGLAPGAHGANRTGRMFTGDSSGDFLYKVFLRPALPLNPPAFRETTG